MPVTHAGPKVMSEARVLDFFAACNAGDLDAIAGFFTENAQYFGSIGPDDNGTEFNGRNEVREGMAAFLGSYRAAHYSDVKVVVTGNRGFATWTFSGTPSSATRINYRGVDIFEFEGDRIRVKDAFRKERAALIDSARVD